MKSIEAFVQQGRAANEATVFKRCFERGLSELVGGKVGPSLSLSENRKRWPHIYDAWTTNQFGNDVKAPYLSALDLLEEKLTKEKP